MIRAPGICNRNEETTVLCHYRLQGVSGIGYKAPDICGAWGCSACHDLVDGRAISPAYSRIEVRLLHAEGVIRTLDALHEMGYFEGG
jgi:hypothetical protein